jgi:hypothetical protein
LKRAKRGSGFRPRRRAPVETLDVGQKVRDARERRVGVVLDLARQYSHPKAQPVHNYLVRWEDGQVEAISETALGPAPGIEPID